MKDIINIDLYRVNFLGFIKVSLMLLALISFTASAQDQQISGTITDETGAGLPGASVLVKGTSTGTVTDMNGKYSLTAGSDDVLVISFIGYSQQEVSVGGRSTIDLQMQLDAEQLSEVVITGYGSDSRRETSGSVATVDSKSLTTVPSGNVEQQLQGRVAGVTVITNGQPGTTSQVRVRGFGALGGNEPLYVVDGVSISGGIDFLSPDDIESTTVLKDATAASIYGSRAASGVIVIATKKGKRGPQPMKVEYNGMIGVTTPGQGIDMLSPQEHADWTWNAIRNAATNQTFLNSIDDDPETGTVDPSFGHPQYGSGETPVVPDYLLVGNSTGVSGDVNLAHHAYRYNVDPNSGGIYQVVRAAEGNGTDWYDEITRNAMLNRHHIGVRGGGESSAYYFGLGVQEQEGILKHQKFQRYTLRANTEFDLLPQLRIGQNFQATYRSVRLLQGDADGAGSADDENVMLSTLRMPTIIPVYDEFGGYAGTSVSGFNNPANPVANLDGQKNNRAFQGQAFGNVYLEIEPIEDLTIRTSFGGRYANFNLWNYTRRTYENSENNSSFGYFQTQGYSTAWQFTNTINYKKDLGNSKFDILLGQEALNFGTMRNMSGSGINPFSQNVDFVSLSTVDSRVVNGGHSNGVNYASYFSQVKYTLMDKYILTAVVRRDGASSFGADNRYGVFPAFSGAWRISSESFMSGLGWLDDMKIRAGYGIMGNSNNVSPNNQYSLYATDIPNSSYDISGTNSSAAQGFYRSRIGNPAAQWERAITTNVGVDALLLDGKIDLIVDLWQKNTEDLLFQLPVTTQTGNFANAPSVNIGEVENKGIDLKIVWKGSINTDTRFEVTANGGFLKNEIVAFAPGLTSVPGFSGNYRGIAPVLNQVGHSISAFYGYEVQGIFADAAEVNSAPTQEAAAPGRFRFVDKDGNGEINANDRTFLGSPVPKFTGGLTVKMFYKDFELEVYGFTSLGNKIYNMTKLFTDFYPLFPGASISSRAKDSWTTENTGTDIPIFENSANFSTMTQSSSYFVEDGSYFRLQNVTLTYNMPQAIKNALNVETFKVFAAMNNVFTITKYSGLDPSVGGAVDTNFGIDLGNFPITRGYTLGVKVGF